MCLRKKVGEECGGDGNERGLADADDDVAQQQLVIVVGDRAQQRGQAPDERADGHDAPARETVGEGNDQRRRNHVADEKGGGQKTDLRIAKGKLFLDEGLHREQHIAIDVVEKIERGQQQQRGPGVGLGRHGWGE